MLPFIVSHRLPLDLKTPDGFLEGLCTDFDLQTPPGQGIFCACSCVYGGVEGLWTDLDLKTPDGGVEGFCTDLDLKTSPWLQCRWLCGRLTYRFWPEDTNWLRDLCSSDMKISS